MIRHQISNRQGGWLVTAAVIATIFLPLPTIVTETAGTAGWISVFLGYGLSLIPAFFIFKISLKFKGKSLPEYTEILLGKFLGKILNFYFLVISLYLTAMVTRVFGNLYIDIMPRTPIIFFTASILILVVYIVRQGIEVLARCNEILIIVVIGSLSTLFLLLLPNISPSSLLPLLGTGLRGIATGTLFVFALASKYVLLLGILLPHFQEQETSFKPVLLGVFIAALVLNSVVVTAVGVLETGEVERYLYPIIQLTKVVELGGFIRGIEILLLGAWTAASLVEISLFMYATIVVASQVFAVRDFRRVVLTTAFLVVTISMLPDNLLATAKELQLLANVFILPLGIIIPPLFFILSRLRGNKNEVSHKNK